MSAASGGWYHVSVVTKYDEREGQDHVTDTWEMLSPTEPSPKSPKTGAFDRTFSYAECKATYSESYYTGNSDPNDGVTCRGTTSQEPLETHPKWQSGGDEEIKADEWAKYKKWQDDPTSTTWTPDTSTAEFKKFWKLKERGIDYFLCPNLDVQVTSIEGSKPSLTNLGRIESLPSPRAMTLKTPRNWLLVGIDYEQLETNSYRLTKTYRASYGGGWDAELYSKT